MPTLYSIVPKNDGYQVLGKRGNQHCLIHKATKPGEKADMLVFSTEESAMDYIVSNKLEDYTAEAFWRSENYDALMEYQLVLLHCPDCGYTLKSMVTVGADESASGCSETLYHCTNEDCESDFSVTRDANGRFIKMTRHFWG